MSTTTTQVLSTAQRSQAGKALRKTIPRAAHSSWTVDADRRDPVENVVCSSQGRLPELIPIRYGRMIRSPFTFLRGSAALMACDLAGTPTTGIEVQACGDCHLLNLGLFATPERNLIFDLRDFDETLRAPWEWDVKRLVTSFAVAGRSNGLSAQCVKDVTTMCACSYRTHMVEFSGMSPLEVWYYRLTADDLIASAPDARTKEQRQQMAARARKRVGENLFPKITEEVDGRHQFVEQPPLTTRLTDDNWQELIREGIEEYRATLPEDRRFVFDRFWLEDFALRVVGIGSVGTRCYVGLFFCDDKNPLLLQVKEARQSVLEPYATKSTFHNQGQRVVVGQRLMQSASDIFLGWFRARTGHDFYVRQLRDMKFVIPVDGFTAAQFEAYADICGWTLARAHARSGDPAMIAGYLGKSDNFDLAVGEFALAYADQVERDYEAFVQAARSGRLGAVAEDS
jgi:uncharacterized protein (DUF2252 family)